MEGAIARPLADPANTSFAVAEAQYEREAMAQETPAMADAP